MGSELTFDALLLHYVHNHTPPEPDILKRLRSETDALGPISEMQISWVQARLMQLLAGIMGAKRYLEIGTFTGYSTFVMSQAMGSEGRTTALDISEEWTSMGRSYWQEAGLDKNIDLILDDACKVLEGFMADESHPPYDIAFIDADKENIQTYFDYCIRLLRPGGLVMVDNVLWSGAVIDEKETGPNTTAIRAFNNHVLEDSRVFLSMIPVGDGILLARKK